MDFCVEDCEKNLRPRVPAIVQVMCEYCELFSDPKVIRELVPMLYVYWG